jgi:hypothetical protein
VLRLPARLFGSLPDAGEYPVIAAMRRRAHDARQEYIARRSNAWRKPKARPPQPIPAAPFQQAIPPVNRRSIHAPGKRKGAVGDADGRPKYGTRIQNKSNRYLTLSASRKFAEYAQSASGEPAGLTRILHPAISYQR